MPAIAPPARADELGSDVERSASDESAVEAGADGAVDVVAESSPSLLSSSGASKSSAETLKQGTWSENWFVGT